MQISFTFDNAAQAAEVLEYINSKDWPGPNAGRPTTSGASASRNGTEGGGSASASAEDTPWDEEPRGPQKHSEPADEDPWASSASGSSKPSTSRSAPSEDVAEVTPGKDFPPSGQYDKQTKSGLQVWSFDKSGAPNCKHGLPAAQVKGYKGKDNASGKPSWTAWWCPAGFSKAWKSACKPDDDAFSF